MERFDCYIKHPGELTPGILFINIFGITSEVLDCYR
nr:MAG TPA: hypothetical protein [Caudoviricetes sp.]